MITNREQGGEGGGGGAALSLSVKFVTSRDLIAAVRPVKNEKGTPSPTPTPLTERPIGPDSSRCLLPFVSVTQEKRRTIALFFSADSTCIVERQTRQIRGTRGITTRDLGFFFPPPPPHSVTFSQLIKCTDVIAATLWLFMDFSF